MPCLIQRVRDGRGEYMRCLPPFYAYRLTEAGGHQYNVEIRLVPRDARAYYLGKRFERADETLATYLRMFHAQGGYQSPMARRFLRGRGRR